jgi:hypothetical protein
METTLNLLELRERLAATPGTLRGLAGGLTTEALTYRESPEAWTVIEVLGHLADCEIHNWVARVAIIRSDAEDKRFAPLDREGGKRRYRDWTAARVLDEFERLRGESLIAFDAMRIQSLELTRQGIHPEFGPVTLQQLLACWVTHDHAHLTQISRIVVRYFGERVGPWSAYFSLLKDR